MATFIGPVATGPFFYLRFRMEISEKQLQELLVQFWMKGFECSCEGQNAEYCSDKSRQAILKEAKEQALDAIDELLGDSHGC